MDLVRFRADVLGGVVATSDVKARVRAAAVEVRDLARTHAPYITGTLRRGLAVEDVSDVRHVEFHVGWDRDTAWYGPLVELGSEHAAPSPHLRVAADEINSRR